MLKPVEKQRVAEEIAEQLRALILTGQYPPGSKLPPERELSKRLRVNRASLREALKKLEHLGLVRIRQGDGTRVQNFMETGGIELVQHLLPLGGGKPELIRDLLEFRRIIGRELVRLAAHRGKDRDGIAKLRAVADKADQASGAAELFDLDFEFYVAIAAMCGNQVMLLLINTVRDGVKNFMPLLANLAAPLDTVRKHHRDLIAAIERGDVQGAGKVADDYLRMGAELAARMGGRPELQPLPLPEWHGRALTRKEVEEIALLARIHLEPDEITQLQGELGAILESFTALAAVDTTDVPAMTHAVPMDLRLRPDEPSPSLPVGEALRGAPAREGDLFVVPAIIEGNQ